MSLLLDKARIIERERGFIAIVLAIGAGLRVMMLLSDKSPWGDEWFTMELIQRPFWRMIWESIQDVHPVGYNLILYFFVSVLGAQEWAFRLPSVLAGVGTIILVYTVSNRVFGHKCATLAAWFVSISPYWLQSSNEMRSYSLFAFVTLLGTLFFLRALQLQTRREWLVYGLAAVAAVNIEHYAWIWLLGTIAASLWIPYASKRIHRSLWVHAIVILACLPSLLLVLYQALFKEHMFQADRLNEYMSLVVWAKKLLGIFWHFTCGYSFSMVTADQVKAYLQGSPGFWFSALATTLATMIVIKAFVKVFNQERVFFILAVTILFAPIIFLGFLYPVRLHARYLSFGAPFFFILLAQGLAAFRSRALRSICLLFLTSVSLYGSLYALALKTDSVHKEDHQAMARYVLEKSGPRDAICASKYSVEHYIRKLGIETRSSILSYDELEAAGPQKFERIWYLGITNMNPVVADRIYNDVSGQMASIGFRPEVDPIRFGGDNALTVVYIYHRIA